MKKTLFSIFTLGLILIVACSAKQKLYRIQGSTEDAFNGLTLYLINPANLSIVDSTTIEEGEFELVRPFTQPELSRVELNATYPISLDFIIEEGNIELLIDSKEKIVKGGPLNDKKNRLDQELADIDREVQAHLDSIKTDHITINEQMAIAKSFSEANRVKERQQELIVASLNDNLDNILSVNALVTLKEEITNEYMEELIAKLSPKFKEHELIKEITNHIHALRSTVEGSMFTDFTVATDLGGTASLSDYVGKGKYVLVDFWASWCGPCLSEIPNLKEIYTTYNGDEFELLGVAVWDKAEASLKKIQDLAIPWPQIINAQSIPTDAYAIKGIPQIILFGPDGTILHRDLRGAQLREKLSKLLRQE